MKIALQRELQGTGVFDNRILFCLSIRCLRYIRPVTPVHKNQRD
jgi:hypothetical protein